MSRLRSFRSLAAAALLVAPMLAGGCISTATYGTGESPELAIFREVLGGFGAPKKQPIEYQPRAPLVLPPTGETLPPPVETAAVANPDWPVDPNAASAATDFDNPERAVSPEEAQRLAPLAVMSSPPTEPQRPDNNYNPSLDVIGKQKQLTAFRTAVAEENSVVSAGGRRYLTEPPDTYREPATTAPTEFEEIEKKKKGGFFCITCWF
jgi:hypothetical protein